MNIEIGSKVKVKKLENCVRWFTLCCPEEMDGVSVEDLLFTVEEIDTKDYYLRVGEGVYNETFYFPKETVYLVEQDNPFAQDSLPIGTVIEWEGKNVKVVKWDNCNDCIFYENRCTADMSYVNCTKCSNSDDISRKYILINEQHRRNKMNEIKVDSVVRDTVSGLIGEMLELNTLGSTPEVREEMKANYPKVTIPLEELEIHLSDSKEPLFKRKGVETEPKTLMEFVELEIKALCTHLYPREDGNYSLPEEKL
jgi:hypothetical protein